MNEDDWLAVSATKHNLTKRQKEEEEEQEE